MPLDFLTLPRVPWDPKDKDTRLCKDAERRHSKATLTVTGLFMPWHLAFRFHKFNFCFSRGYYLNVSTRLAIKLCRRML